MDFIFGRSLGFLQSEVPAEAIDFSESFSKALSWTVKRKDKGWLQFQISRFIENKSYKAAYTKVHNYVDAEVARALRETADVKSKSKDCSTERKRYILLDEVATQIRDPIQLRYHVLGVFFPGRDTTAIAISNILFQLARHPYVWKKLRESVFEIGDTPLTFESLKSLMYFKYVFYETIRTVGPAGRVYRVAVRDTILPVGGGPDKKSPVFVPRGTPVVSNNWSLNKDKDIWGDDANEFKPERWIDRKSLWEFVPFWGGPRICPAQQQVLTYTIYLLVKLTQMFERIENGDSVHAFVNRATSVESANGIKIALKNS